jgi:hydroxyacylglutathione hydrolase
MVVAIVVIMAVAQLIHEILPVGLLQCNCMILGDPQTREAIVLDPGDEVARVLTVLARHSLTVRAIVSTHAHIDHVGGLYKLKQATGAPVLMHPDDFDLYRHLDIQATMIGVPAPQMTEVDQPLREGDTVRWGRFSAQVLHTPGHSPGSVSMYLPPGSAQTEAPPAKSAFAAHADPVPGKLFAGDTLFAGSIGRTDLWGGSMKQILSSIHHKLLTLPEETAVYPGHGPSTTIAEERAQNPFLRLSDRPPRCP